MTSLFDISCAWVSTLRSDLASADSSFALTGRLLAGSSLPPLSIPFKRGERHLCDHRFEDLWGDFGVWLYI